MKSSVWKRTSPPYVCPRGHVHYKGSEFCTVCGAGPVLAGGSMSVSPHTFRRRGWRFWICTHCFAPRHMHPRRTWVRSRPHGENYYLSASAPHFKEGW